MKVVVIYDSAYGNTEKVAKAIGSAITGEARVLRAGEVNPADLPPIDFLFVGSPTQAGRPTPAVQNFLSGIPESSVKGIKVAAFDTRISPKWVGIFGYAAGKIAESLKKNGGTLAAPPEGFFVKAKEGPMKDGELERAAGWAREIVK